jgi:hypothetical protein
LYASEEEKIDPCKFDRPIPIWFENHLWNISCLEHSRECPCNNYEKYSDENMGD